MSEASHVKGIMPISAKHTIAFVNDSNTKFELDSKKLCKWPHGPQLSYLPTELPYCGKMLSGFPFKRAFSFTFSIKDYTTVDSPVSKLKLGGNS